MREIEAAKKKGRPTMSVELEAKREQMRAVMAKRRERRKADPWSNHMSSAPDMELFDEVRRFVDSLAGEELEPSTGVVELSHDVRCSMDQV